MSSSPRQRIGADLELHHLRPLAVALAIPTVARCRYLTRLPAPMHLCEDLRIRHGQDITTLATRYLVPAVYWSRDFAELGGLISYGPDVFDEFRRAASYADRILKGEKPSELPVQAPVKFKLVINLKTAKALGLEVPPMLLARADEVIE